MSKQHEFTSNVVWTGNTGEGTKAYKSYARTWDIAVPSKAVVHCSNDPLLGGDPRKMNPEDLLLSALSACHMLWYLHYASEAGVIVTAYTDTPLGLGESGPNGAGRFLEVVLKPVVTVAHGSDIRIARSLHDKIHKVCFIARSVNFPVSYKPEFIVE